MKTQRLKMLTESLSFKGPKDWAVLLWIPLAWILNLVLPILVAVPASVFLVSMLSYRLESINTVFPVQIWAIRSLVLSVFSVLVVYVVFFVWRVVF